jgi:transglutaminase-like putative cysteine protease
MKTYNLLACFILFYSFGFSQLTKVKTGSKGLWIEDISFDKNAVPPTGQESSYYYLLMDEQENVSQQEQFIRYVYKMLTSEGIQQMSDLSVDFDPSYEQLTFNSILIHRDGKTIDKLPKEIRTIQREQSMDRYLYDESVTALVNLSDVRVGDIIEYSYTRKGYNPVYDGHFGRKKSFNYSVAMEKDFQRLIAPSLLELSFKNINTDIQPVIEKKNNTTIYTWTSHKVDAHLSDNYEPDWYTSYAYTTITSFKSWRDVAAWAFKRYKVSNQDKQTVLKEIVSKFKFTSPEQYTLDVIRFVQDEIRYLGFESGLNSHLPHSPTKVYDQRFGDCKDKSLLLTALLNARSIEAYPVLVNTSFCEKLSDELPRTNSFNHCVVQIKLNGRVFYIDPTIANQGGDLTNYYFPMYGKGLVVSAATTDLTDIPAQGTSSTTEVQTFDVATIGGEGMLKMETTYTGSEADNQRSYFSTNNMEKIQKDYLTYYGNVYPDIQKFELIRFEDDRKANVFKVKESYKIPTFWKKSDQQEGRIYIEFYSQSLETYFNVSKSAQRTSPYKLTYPLNFISEIHVNLPEEWPIDNDEVVFDNDYYHYKYELKYANEKLSLLTNYKTKKESVPVNTFSEFVSDHGKMTSNLSYSLFYNPPTEAASGNKWPGIALSFFTLIMGAWLSIRLYKEYDPQPHYPAAWGQPIGGWLVLVAIGLSVTPLRILYDFFTNTAMISSEGWTAMWSIGNYAFSILLIILHIYNLVYLLFSALVVILFFQRRSSVPLLVTILYSGSCIATIVDNAGAYYFDPTTVVDSKAIIQSIITCAIWIPYFHQSIRVKKTFVNVYREDENPENVTSQSSLTT